VDLRVATVEVGPATATLAVGDTLRLTARARALDGTLVDAPTAWSGDGQRVAIVPQGNTARITALLPGTTVVTAAVQGKSGEATFELVATPPVPVPVASVRLDADSIALEEGEFRQLVATAFDAQGRTVTGRVVHWTSSDPGVAYVSAGGLVTPVGTGAATITARVDATTASIPIRVYSRHAYDLLYDAFTGAFVEVLRKDIRLPGTGAARIFPNQRWATDPAGSPDGSRIAVVRNDATGPRGIWLVNPDGSGVFEVTSGIDDQPAWSPGGDHIVFRRRVPGGGTDIWVVNADGTGATNLTADHGATSQSSPAWSPAGRIAYSHAAAGEAHIWTMAANGSDKRQITTGAVYDDEPAWSPDGARLAFQRFGDIWLAFATGGAPWPLVQLYFGQFAPAWSPDGLLVAFTSKDAAGTFQIFTVRADGTGVAQRTHDSAAPGAALAPHKGNPAWLLRQ
jgi:hypothetical protein